MAKDKYKKEKEIAIISDSRSALQVIGDGHHRHPLAVAIRAAVQELEMRGTQVTLFWIKAHVGLPGNERANELAKKAALHKKTSPAYDFVPLSSVKWHLREHTVMKWQQRYDEDETGATTKLFFPDVRLAHKVLKNYTMDNKYCQIFTGHGGFGAYLHRFKLKSSPSCECDGITPETVIHLICDCPRFLAERTDLEIVTGISVKQQNLQEFLNTEKHRQSFIDYSCNIVTKANIANKSKVVLQRVVV